MDPFYPFIYNPKYSKKDEPQQIPLYIELVPPPQEEVEEKEENQEEIGVIIIDML